MDSKRFLLAIALSLAIIFGVQALFPVGKQGAAPPKKPADTSAVMRARAGVGDSASAAATNTPTTTAAATTTAAPASSTPSTATPTTAPAQIATITAPSNHGATFRFSSVGAEPIAVVMNDYANRVTSRPVDLASGGRGILKYQVVTNGGAPVPLSNVAFTPTQTGNTVTYQGSANGTPVSIEYATQPDSFVAHVTGTVTAPATGGANYLVVTLPETFAATESDTADDRNALAYAFETKHEAARSVNFRSLDPGEKQLVTGPLAWIAAKSKYFVVGMLAPANTTGFTEATLTGTPRSSKLVTTANGIVVVPIVNGHFAFDLYAGPQEWKRLHSLGRDFDQVNPYGWAWARPFMQPIATGVIRLVLWMHSSLALSYGMVLIALGVLVRLIMWPLYQSSMRTSLKMQVLQPELQAVQDRYKDDPERQRVEIMKVYQEHGMNPLSPLLGCLPSLLPMPVLLALFFVFRNTIEFRGVPFFWLHDLSVRDPFYILPILMGASMYLISWIGMRNAPPNPQAKMMSYMMPAMFMIFFYRAAAGLNLYYATQNIASLPQQWLLAKSRTTPKKS